MRKTWNIPVEIIFSLFVICLGFTWVLLEFYESLTHLFREGSSYDYFCSFRSFIDGLAINKKSISTLRGWLMILQDKCHSGVCVTLFSTQFVIRNCLSLQERKGDDFKELILIPLFLSSLESLTWLFVINKQINTNNNAFYAEITSSFVSHHLPFNETLFPHECIIEDARLDKGVSTLCIFRKKKAVVQTIKDKNVAVKSKSRDTEWNVLNHRHDDCLLDLSTHWPSLAPRYHRSFNDVSLWQTSHHAKYRNNSIMFIKGCVLESTRKYKKV